MSDLMMAKRGSHNGRYILAGKVPVPCEDLLTWARWIEDHNRDRIVRQEEVGKFFVSTVFLGLDHDFSFEGPPLLFETMVFDGRKGGSVNDAPAFRDWTWELALESHAKAVEWARNQLH